MKTTLDKIRANSPCASGWKNLLSNLGKTKADDEPLSIITILESNGLDDALWCLRVVDDYQHEMRLFAVDCARSVQHLTNDQRSIAAIDIAERYANGLATNQELDAARNAAGDAARNAAGDASWDAARDAARDAAWALAGDAAWASALASARDAARDAALASALASATRDAAWDAAWDAARDTQTNLLCIICAEIEQREDIYELL
jgi:hypothetical protein